MSLENTNENDMIGLEWIISRIDSIGGKLNSLHKDIDRIGHEEFIKKKDYIRRRMDALRDMGLMYIQDARSYLKNK